MIENKGRKQKSKTRIFVIFLNVFGKQLKEKKSTPANVMLQNKTKFIKTIKHNT